MDIRGGFIMSKIIILAGSPRKEGNICYWKS